MKKLLFICAALLMLSSCSQKYTREEIAEAITPLIEKSAELNEIYFGEGLPLSVEKEDAEKFYSSFDSEIKSINYHPVDKDCGYESIDEIKAATLEVFTEEYSEYLFQKAFNGISDQINDGTGDITQTASYAMYLEQNGMLTARINIADDAIELGRVYDVDSLEIKLQKSNYVIVSIPTEQSGKPLDVELKLVMTDSGWRLDSPTY